MAVELSIVSDAIARKFAMNRYGFIGLGDQGAPIAQRMIDAGFSVALWARRTETLEAFADTDATLFDDIGQFSMAIKYLGICVVDDQGVRSLCDQVMPLMQPGSTIVIHSTVSPALCIKLADEAKKYEINVLDAPVSGGSPAAKNGSLTVMVGGEIKTLENIREVFEAFSSLIIHLGEVGSGQHAKIINNSLLAANMGLAHYCLKAAEDLSLDRQSFIQLINESSGRSFGFEVCARLSQPKDFQHGASLLEKDIGLLESVLGNHSSVSAIQSAAKEFLDLALQRE